MVAGDAVRVAGTSTAKAAFTSARTAAGLPLPTCRPWAARCIESARTRRLAPRGTRTSTCYAPSNPPGPTSCSPPDAHGRQAVMGSRGTAHHCQLVTSTGGRDVHQGPGSQVGIVPLRRVEGGQPALLGVAGPPDTGQDHLGELRALGSVHGQHADPVKNGTAAVDLPGR